MRWEVEARDVDGAGVVWRMAYEGSPLPGALPQCFLSLNAENWRRISEGKRTRLFALVAAYSARVRRTLEWVEDDLVSSRGDVEREVYLGPIPWDGELHRELARTIPRRCPLICFDPIAGIERDPRPVPAPPQAAESDDDDTEGVAA